MEEVRRIRAEETTEAMKVFSIAFNNRHDFNAPEPPPDPFEEPFDWIWAAFDGGRMLSKITEIPYVMRFDGNDAKMSGIGGVATLPEARKGGRIRRIFEALLNDAYANGVIFSCLGPFSHAFYRKFGYELCGVRKEIRIPLDQMESIKSGGSYELILPGGDTEGLRRVHEAYIAGINHAIRRDTRPNDAMWREFTKNDPYSTGYFVYLWRDDAGVPRSYIKYAHKKSDGRNKMHVDELMFADRDALYAQLAFAGALSSEINDFVWRMPEYIDPFDFFDVAWGAKQNVSPCDMTRIVNVRAALEMMRRPEGSGRYTVGVEDEIISDNSGNWQVEFGPEGNRVTAYNGAPDIVCDMPALAQLITGYRTFDSIRFSTRRRFEVNGNEQTLRDVFTQRPQHVTEYF